MLEYIPNPKLIKELILLKFTMNNLLAQLIEYA
jgi:hypothetical protein